MILQIENITAEPNQRHTIELEGGNVTLVLRYHPQIEQWTMDVERNEKAIYGARLAVGTRHIQSRNMGVDFVVVAEGDIDPFQIDDFETGRCALLMQVENV